MGGEESLGRRDGKSESCVGEMHYFLSSRLVRPPRRLCYLSHELDIISCWGESKVRESEGAPGSSSNERLPSISSRPSEVKGGVPRK